MFTLEIAGRSIAVLNVPTWADAEEWLGDEEVRQDLTILEHEGKPLWDGRAALQLRESIPSERSEFESALEDDEPDARTDAVQEDDDAGLVMFLVDVTDPDDPSDTDA